jgi:hypothetical protein
MRAPTLDPTAGERARRLRLEPDSEPRVTDPTNPRYGRLGGHVGRRVDPTDTRQVGGRVGRVVDPTDPACARRTE